MVTASANACAEDGNLKIHSATTDMRHTCCVCRPQSSLKLSKLRAPSLRDQGCMHDVLRALMHVQLRDADVASAELVEEKRLSRELSAQVQDFTEGTCEDDAFHAIPG